MKYSKLVMLGLIGVLTFGAVGCTNKTADKNQNQSTDQTANNMYKDMTLEGYKTEFSKMYESNIAGFKGYEPIRVEQPTANYPGNEKYVADLKKNYEESKNKVDELTTSLKKVETKDPQVKEMNDKLIAESEKISKELDARIKKLGEIPSDLMTKSEVEFRQGLSDLFEVNETIKSDFMKFIDDTKEFFGIKTK
ncbi:hypothetical protein LZ906_011095 [Paraclostridium ghonii]|uniref:hypothetical protein n=1 Tax=Paraclostridium ghonii TaxID=29358 RepID=UPI00202CF885|nr:hypothetical protein [Paeniclostridium ghonii]MCM0165991.1 hypothetical protein [Paeniclostridium ghonii]